MSLLAPLLIFLRVWKPAKLFYIIVSMYDENKSQFSSVKSHWVAKVWNFGESDLPFLMPWKPVENEYNSMEVFAGFGILISPVKLASQWSLTLRLASYAASSFGCFLFFEQ